MINKTFVVSYSFKLKEKKSQVKKEKLWVKLNVAVNHSTEKTVHKQNFYSEKTDAGSESLKH